MENKSSMKVIKAALAAGAFIMLTTLLGDYVISREINPGIQLAATALWLAGSVELGKLFINLLKS
jgi:hypothetical protein